MRKWLAVLMAAALCAVFLPGWACAAETYFSIAEGYPGTPVVDPSGNFVYSYSSNILYKTDTSGNLVSQWTLPFTPQALAVDPHDNIYVAYAPWAAGAYATVLEYDANGNQLGSWTFSSTGVHFMVAGGPNGNLYIYYQNGRDTVTQHLVEFTPTGAQVLIYPVYGYAAVDGAGNVYVSGGSAGNEINKYDPSGNLLLSIPLNGAQHVAVDGSNNIYANTSHSISKFDQNGNLLSSFDSWMEVDQSGNCAGGLVGVYYNQYGAQLSCDNGNEDITYIGSLSVDSAGQMFSGVSGGAIELVGSGMVNVKVMNNGSPVQGAYLYVQPSPMLMADKSSPGIIGPSDANGFINGPLPTGKWYFRVTARGAADSGTPHFAPPMKGDLSWIGPAQGMTVPENGALSLGTVNLSQYTVPGTSPMSISGTVTGGQTNSPISNWFVFAAKAPIQRLTATGGRGPVGAKFAAQALTDASGNYTISLCHPGTYYVYVCSAPGKCNCNGSYRGNTCGAEYYNSATATKYLYPGGYPTCNTTSWSALAQAYIGGNCPTIVNQNQNVTGVNVGIPGQ